MNVAIAAVLYLALGGISPADGLAVENPGVGLLQRLASVNLFIAVFNLIPAFPMDGGRVLRALLARRLGYGRATQIAASVGQALAFALGLLGLFGNPLLIFIALFVYLAASSEAHAIQMREASRGMLAEDAMITRFEGLNMASRVDDAVECLIRTTQHEFPVVDEAGRLRGMLTRDEMIKALKERGPATPVVEVMRTDIPQVEQRRSLVEALRPMQEQKLPAVGIVDRDGRFVGFVTPENVGELMMVQAAYPKRRAGTPWRPEAPRTST